MTVRFRALRPRFSAFFSIWDEQNDEYLHDPEIDTLEVSDYEPISFASQEDAQHMARLLNLWKIGDTV